MTITHTFETEEKVQKRRFPKITIIFAVLLITLGILEIWVSHTLASYGEKFEGIEKLKITLNLENKILENEIAKLSTLSEIATQSGELGLKKSTNIQYIH
jgi:hypothetical protein